MQLLSLRGSSGIAPVPDLAPQRPGWPAGLALALLLAAVLPAAAQPTPPRLAGVAVGPDTRVAIFAAPDGNWLVAGEGENVGGFMVLRILPGRAELAGPDGSRRQMVPQPDPNLASSAATVAPPPQPADPTPPMPGRHQRSR